MALAILLGGIVERILDASDSSLRSPSEIALTANFVALYIAEVGATL